MKTWSEGFTETVSHFIGHGVLVARILWDCGVEQEEDTWNSVCTCQYNSIFLVCVAIRSDPFRPKQIER